MIGRISSEYTFTLVGSEWSLTEPVKAYLEWFAIEVNYLHHDVDYDSFVWNDGVLYYTPPESETNSEPDDPSLIKVFTPQEAVSELFDDLSDAAIWGWLIGCNLTSEAPTGVEPDADVFTTTQHRITEVIAWHIAADADNRMPPKLRMFAHSVLSVYSEEDWEKAIATDPNLKRVKKTLSL